jgi:flagellar biosynthetic protein FliR
VNAATLPQLVIAAFLTFCRVGSCFMIMPGFSSARVPMQVRLFVAVAVSLALFMNLSDVILPHAGTGTAVLLKTTISEILTGLLIGIVARFFLLALEFITTAISTMIGFSGSGGVSLLEDYAETPLGALISFSALMLLFALNFHLEIIRALISSYRIAPIDVLFDPQAALANVSDTISDAFFVTLRLGSPFVAYALLINLTTGLINKLAPQIPVYFISLPFIIAGGLVLMYVGIPSLLSLYADSFLPVTIGR